jgi:hypothetical protein
MIKPAGIGVGCESFIDRRYIQNSAGIILGYNE